jgi:hypothetical protein
MVVSAEAHTMLAHFVSSFAIIDQSTAGSGNKSALYIL